MVKWACQGEDRSICSAGECEKNEILRWSPKSFYCCITCCKHSFYALFSFLCTLYTQFLGDRLWNASPYAIRPLSVSPVRSVTLAYCGQTAGWIKIKLGMHAGLGPGQTVLDGDAAPLPKKEQSPLANFRPMSSIVANGWTHQDATLYGGRPRPSRGG